MSALWVPYRCRMDAAKVLYWCRIDVVWVSYGCGVGVVWVRYGRRIGEVWAWAQIGLGILFIIEFITDFRPWVWVSYGNRIDAFLDAKTGLEQYT